ncbi:MAG: efflux RND transporter permease subunit, partial [Candidatus Competibacteraceae bacterium]|nr:efflux RND transporter permease subunit [Candidatus Competibacteraceae bacterium]
MLRALLQNHILANLAFVLVLVMGTLAYLNLPRQQDPTVNFNWIRIRTIMPGASATDVEQRVTDVLEEAVDKVSDIKFVTSTSRPNVSEILLRFNELDDETFDKRVVDLRREIQNRDSDLPMEAEQPEITEITSASAYPTTMVLVVGKARDENLRQQAQRVREDLERLGTIDRVDAIGEQDPELQVLFDPDRLVGLGLSPADLADTVAAHFRDVAAGSVKLGDQKWLIRLIGTDADPRYLSSLPIISAQGEVPLGSVADVVRAREEPTQLVRYGTDPVVMLALFKKGDANVLSLVDEIDDYITTHNRLGELTGTRLILLSDPTTVTRSALSVMQSNALVGLALVMVVTWLFLGTKLAFFTGIGIPFVLAGVFWLLSVLGQTLNVIVLLGVVISLGMLV